MEHYQVLLSDIFFEAQNIAQDFFDARVEVRKNEVYSEWGELTVFVKQRLRPGTGLLVPTIEWQNIKYFGKSKNGKPRRKQEHITRGKADTYPLSAFNKFNPVPWQIKWIEQNEPRLGELRKRTRVITTVIKQLVIAEKEVKRSQIRLEALRSA